MHIKNVREICIEWDNDRRYVVVVVVVVVVSQSVDSVVFDILVRNTYITVRNSQGALKM